MGIKTNELQKTTNFTTSDSILADTESVGTARIEMSALKSFFGEELKDIFLSGGVPYGKELTDSWSALQTKIKAGNFTGIHIGDYKTITLTTGEKVVCEVAGIDTYYKGGDSTIGHHIDFISRDCLANSPSGKFVFNSTNINNGTQAEPSPWMASALFQTLNDETSGVFSTLPVDLKSVIIEKRALLASRYSAGGTVSDDTGWAWNSAGKLWLPSEVEVFGYCSWSNPGYGIGDGKQYPIFFGGNKHIIKGNGNGGSRCHWWELSAERGSSTYFCLVDIYGYATTSYASHAGFAAPLCFRVG